MKKSSMNLPNTLSIIRCLLVPVFVASLLLLRNAGILGYLIPAAVYGLTALTDMLDGKIARKYNLITDFGKFIDPLADKFMVLSSMISILVWMLLRGKTMMALIFVWVVLVILLRELGVTSIRLVVAGKSGIVIAASALGKMKTISQMVGTVVILLEPAIPVIGQYGVLTYIAMAVMCFTTIFSGIDYLKAYMPYIDSNK
jgi:CDP-diacylglycerol--glycerol-3-phosphate 3-phosphatidyltransferase